MENVPQVATVLSTLAALICIISKSYKTFTEGKKAKEKSQKIDAEIMKNLQKDLEQRAISTSNNIVLRDTGNLLFLASKNLLIVLGAIKETANIGDILVKMEKS